MGEGLPLVAQADLLAIHVDLTGVEFAVAEQSVEQLHLSVAGKAGNAQDLALFQFEVQVVHHLEEPLDLFFAQSGGSLVQDQHIRVLVERLGDLHQLHLAQRQIAHHDPGIQIQPDLLQKDLGLVVDLPEVDPPEPVPGLISQEDILRHGEVLDQGQLLEHRRDLVGLGVLGTVDVDLLPLHVDVAAVPGGDAADDLDHGALSGAVFADEHMGLAPIALHLGVVECHDAAEPLADVSGLDQRDHGLLPGRRAGGALFNNLFHVQSSPYCIHNVRRGRLLSF